MDDAVKDLVGAFKAQQEETFQFFRSQQLQAEGRETKLDDLLEQTLTGRLSQFAPRSVPVPPAIKPHPVNTSNKPTLLSNASLAEFTSWKETWMDFARCQ